MFVLLVCALVGLSSCEKYDFYAKFVPEVLYYEKDKVENADFKQTTLAAGVTQWTVKARISAPMKLKEIKLYRIAGGKEDLVTTYNDLRLTPNVFNLVAAWDKITAETTVKIVATDNDNRVTARNFIIKVTP